MTFRRITRCGDSNTSRFRRATFILGALLAATSASTTFAHSQEGITTVDRLVDEAGQAKIDGNLALSYALLHEAVRIAPDDSQARWQLGQLKVAGEWLSVEEAERRAAADPRQIKLLDRRQALGESPEGQLALARWCRNNDLNDEARFYWASVLSVEPANKEALRALGMRWHDGEPMTPAQIKASRIESTDSKKAMRRWTSAVADWLRALSDKNERPPSDVLDAIRAVDDLAAIPAFEIVTLNSSLSPNEKNPAPKRLSLTFLGALSDMTDDAATKSLVRHAVLSPFAEVRSEAIYKLRERPLPDFVPMLLDGLVAPVQSAYQVLTDPDGSVHYLHALYREGAFADRSYRSSRSIYQLGSPIGMAANILTPENSSAVLTNMTNINNTPSRTVSSAGARRSARQYEQEIAERELQVAQANQATAASNERIIAVLSGVTEQSLGSEPRAWWTWWQDYTDYYHTDARPVYATLDSSNDYIVPPDSSSVGVECFARGTPVWTKTGERPIESLAIGDLVLAQNVDTGELTYKAVIGRTLRPAGPIVQLSVGGEKLLATRGHPLWVAGLGWRMAKELEDGAVLHGVTGAARIGAVEPATNAETYNLVVADFNTYFVGESGILAHDNTPRKPTRALVPGMLAK